MGYYDWKPYVPVAKRRAQAERAVARAGKAGQQMQPVRIEGRTIAKTFWGRAWCDNLEAYSDYDNRLPRGRAYVRNGAVIDLRIEPGKVLAQVMGSSLYQVEIAIDTVSESHWRALVQACAGSIASLVELLQGRLSKAVMERICAPRTGLFPSPSEIRFDCTCPDWASMCKHVAAALYGVGARLDQAPELLFTLRGVDANDLVAAAAELPIETAKSPATGKRLDDALLAEVFGIELDSAALAPASGADKKAKGRSRVAPPLSSPQGQAKAGAKKQAHAVPQTTAEKSRATRRAAPSAVTRKADTSAGGKKTGRQLPSGAQARRKTAKT